MERRDLGSSGSKRATVGPVLRKRPTGVRRSRDDGTLDGTMVTRKVRRTVNQRREPRLARPPHPVTIRWQGGEATGTLLNFSPTGFMAECEVAVGIGESVSVDFEGCSSVAAAVIWRKGNQLGVDFGRPVVEVMPDI